MPLPRIAIATGDPAGIGPEIALKAALDARVRSLCRPLLVGDPAAVETHARTSGLSPSLHVLKKPSEAQWSDGTVNLLDARDGSNVPVKIGTVDAAYGRASLASAGRAIKAALAGDVEAVVAAPQTERSIAAAGIAFDGYPSFVARETGTPVNDVYLMICFDQSRIVHATLHVSVREAVALITLERVERVIRVTDASLKKLGIARPKIFVSGLNPHAGESGLFGDEEERVLGPAARALEAAGPLPADTVFVRALRGEFDAVLAPYHDVGMTAIKVASFGSAVNVTLGLPFVRTSPDHGTAFDIAGKGTADPSSLIAAISLAARLSATAPALVPAK